MGINERVKDEDTQEIELCPKGTYIEENNFENVCTNCFEEAKCEGGYIPIYPKKEYWRQNNFS